MINLFRLKLLRGSADTRRIAYLRAGRVAGCRGFAETLHATSLRRPPAFFNPRVTALLLRFAILTTVLARITILNNMRAQQPPAHMPENVRRAGNLLSF
jgi:hypothetical protein